MRHCRRLFRLPPRIAAPHTPLDSHYYIAAAYMPSACYASAITDKRH